MITNEQLEQISYDEMSYREDYLDHKRGVKAKSFEELIRILDEPVDEEELDMLAYRVDEILTRRIHIVAKAEKICKSTDELDSGILEE